jgi:hypothetical protein
MSIEDLWRGMAERELRAEIAHLRQHLATAIETLQIMERSCGRRTMLSDKRRQRR